MRDLVYLTITVGFFALGAAAVRLCDRIVGPDGLERAETAAGPSAKTEAPAG